MVRQQWSRRIEFMMTAVGFSVGIGDLWRFPYMVMNNGGGAFLIPAIIFNIFGAIPIVYLEMIMGQYSQSSAMTVWSVCPLFKGVGFGTVIATFIFSIYYAVIICWMLYYFIHSFFPNLPWASCDNSWNVPETCMLAKTDIIARTESLYNVTSNVTYVTSNVTYVMANVTSFPDSSTMSTTNDSMAPVGELMTSAEQFWKYEVMKLSSGLEELGFINWPLVGCLAVIELICFLCIFKGVKITGKEHHIHHVDFAPNLVVGSLIIRPQVLFGKRLIKEIFERFVELNQSIKSRWGLCMTGWITNMEYTDKFASLQVVYFTVLGPFVLLLVFLVRGLLLPGSEIGIKYYLTPDPEKLLEPSIWAQACMQVFRSIGPGSGVMITFASFNKFSNNCMRDAIIVCLADLVTGFVGGFVIFSVLGHVSYQTGIDIKNFNQSGFGLGFIAYPEAANYLPPPQLWCVLFFFMSLTLGIDSTFPNFEIVVTSLMDQFPKQFKDRTVLLTTAIIGSAFILAIPYLTQGGMYLLTLVDWYAMTFNVTVFALLECLVMVWVYGMANIDSNMKEMTGQSVPIVFKACWYFVTPFLLAISLGFSIYSYTPPVYSGYEYPPWAVAFGWCIAAVSLLPIPLYIMYKLCKVPGTLSQRIKKTIKPSIKWGPRPDELEPCTDSKDKGKGLEPLDVSRLHPDLNGKDEYGSSNGRHEVPDSTRL